MNDLVFCSATELAEAIRNRQVSALEVLEAFLARIASSNHDVNALVTLNEAGARKLALRADEALANGEVWGPLHGVPVTLKDVFETAGLRTTACHEPLADHVPKQDATVVARLRRAGAIVLGKTNMPALAMDTQCENSMFGCTKNPWNLERTAGGSSGGEAAALAAGMSPLGLGSDIGGSVRIPAHYCGVLCLKPTEGRVPLTGHIPPLPGTVNWIRHMAVAGPMARSVADLRLCLKIIAGPDGYDCSISPAPWADVPVRPLSSYRFAWSDDFAGLPVTTDTRDAMAELAGKLSNAGCRVERASPRGLDFDRVWETYGNMVGIMMAANIPLLPRAAMRALGNILFQKDLITRAGTRAATANMAKYFAVLHQRDTIIHSVERFLGEYDAWLCPVCSTPAFAHRKVGKINTPLDVDGTLVPGHLGTIGYTAPFNLTGHPVVVLPLGSSKEGLPIGFQVVGRRWDEMALLSTAEALTGVVGSFRRPPLC